jgi:hypothetical protein
VAAVVSETAMHGYVLVDSGLRVRYDEIGHGSQTLVEDTDQAAVSETGAGGGSSASTGTDLGATM